MGKLEKEESSDFAAHCLGIMLGMLKDRYTDERIKDMLNPKKLDAMLKILEKDHGKL
jgi:hypothetical protein